MGKRLSDPDDQGEKYHGGIPRNYAYQNPFLENDEPIPGVCCVCGCEDENACEGGCEWVNVERTLCSACLTMLGVIPLRMLKHYSGRLLPIAKLGAAMPVREGEKRSEVRGQRSVKKKRGVRR